MSKNPQWAGVHNLDSLDQMQTVEVDPESRERRHKGNKYGCQTRLTRDGKSPQSIWVLENGRSEPMTRRPMSHRPK